MPEDRLSGDVAELQDDMAQVKETLVKHDTRFDNGRHAMAEIRGRIEKVEPMMASTAAQHAWRRTRSGSAARLWLLIGAGTCGLEEAAIDAVR